MYIGNDLQVAESGNKIIEDISSSFNGSTTSFALLVGGAAPVPFPINTQQIYISVNGVIQEPDPTGSAGFKLLGNNIVFSAAPANGHAFFGVILSGADYVTVGTEFPAGSATAPSVTWSTDNNSGFYSVDHQVYNADCDSLVLVEGPLEVGDYLVHLTSTSNPTYTATFSLEEGVLGCMEQYANNYDALANIAGECDYSCAEVSA